MKRISRDLARKFAFDWRDEPLLTVEPGEAFEVETFDASNGYIRSEQDKAIPALRPGFDRMPPQANPIAGPIWVEGAERGDALVVAIEEIVVDDYSWIAIGPRRGPLGESTRWPELSGDYTTKVFRHTPGPSGTMRDGTLHFDANRSWPITPFVGTLGVAPDREVTTSIDGQGEWGGNLDIRDVAAGNTVMLPVFHAGARFYLGDVHASQGDTEFTGTAAETCATVRLRLELKKGYRIPGPRIEKPGSLVAIHADRPLDHAVETATVHLMDWMIAEYGLSPTDAYCLVSTCPDFRINVYQMCRIRNLRPVAGAEIPKRYLPGGTDELRECNDRPESAGLGSPPGPPARGLSGNLREFSADRLGTLARWAREYGDLVSARFGPQRILFANHPDLVEEVLVHQNRKFIKHYRLRQAKLTLGEGLLTSEGDFWRAQRKLAQPAFHRERIAAFGGLMVEFTERLIAAWADGPARDIQADMMQLTLEIVAKALFGAELGGESAEVRTAMETLMHSFIASTSMPIIIPRWLPTPSNLRVAAAVRRLNRVLFHIIAERRKGPADGGDLLSMLLHAQDEESGRRMTDRQLRDECMTLFLAGHETTANTLSWTWYLLAQHPEAESRLHEELDRVLEGRPPTLADLPRLPYTESVVNEALRLYPPGWMLGREATEPLELGGYRVAKGTTIFMTACVIHRDPRWYDDPDSFRPERWADGLLQRLPRYAYFPFGGGPRICIGNNFALMESALVLATIARKYRLRLAPDAVVEPLPSMTLRPAHGIKMIIILR